MKRFQQFAHSENLLAETLDLFALIALNAAIRNGDAHLKDFGILYDGVEGDAHLAPVYDLVTTTAYLAQVGMALTLNRSNQWPSARDLVQFGEGRSLGTRAAFLKIVERIGDALSETSKEVEAYRREHPKFAAVGERMMEQWEIGRRDSLSLQ